MDCHGIFTEIKLHGKYPLPVFRWQKDPPHRNSRERMGYIESRTNEGFSVQVMFRRESLKFDPSIHFRLSIYFECDRVFTEQISSQKIQNGWTKCIEKANCGPHKGKFFYFMPVALPQRVNDEELERYTKTDQDTVSIRLYRLDVIGEGESRATRALRKQQNQDDFELNINPKIWLKDPEKRLSHRPGLRSKPKQMESLLYGRGQEPHYRYRQHDDEENPFYVFDYKLRSAQLLRELGMMKRSESDELNRAARTHQVRKECEDLARVKAEVKPEGCGADDYDDYDDDSDNDVIFLGERDVTFQCKKCQPDDFGKALRDSTGNWKDRDPVHLRTRRNVSRDTAFERRGTGAQNNPIVVTEIDGEEMDEEIEISEWKEKGKTAELPNEAWTDTLRGLSRDGDGWKSEVREMDPEQFVGRFAVDEDVRDVGCVDGDGEVEICDWRVGADNDIFMEKERRKRRC